MKRTLLAMLLASLPFPAAAVWEYRKQADSMTGKISQVALTISKNEFSFGSPYGGPQRAHLSIRAHPRYGNDVILQIQRGQFMCRSSDCTLLVRFDNRPPMKFEGSEPADNSSDTVFIRNFSKFVSEAKRSKVVKIEAQFFREGARVFEFDIDGLQWAGPAPAPKAELPPSQQIATQNQMKLCNKQAADQKMTGEARAVFMRACLGDAKP